MLLNIYVKFDDTVITAVIHPIHRCFHVKTYAYYIYAVLSPELEFYSSIDFHKLHSFV